ncbi:MAG: hypothetical protein WAR83_03655, partial [Flavobacteriales bacterium]
FNEELIIFEDNDMVCRIGKEERFHVLKGVVRTSARKYLENGIYRMQLVFYYMYLIYKLRWSQERIVYTYRRLIKQDKI